MSIVQVAGLLLPLVDKVPEAKDVKAGWTAFAIFGALAVAVALLGVSLTRHLRTAERNLKVPDVQDEAVDVDHPTQTPGLPGVTGPASTSEH